MDTYSDINTRIKKEADEILYKKGLFGLLSEYGQAHIHGSYLLDLMTWRDLDIYLETDSINEAKFFELGTKIHDLLTPVKMSFRNERQVKSPGLPHGLYWGVYLGNERAGAWKIDIWAIGSHECRALLRSCAAIKAKLTPENSQTILEIKSQCWQDPQYRRSYSSAEIYDAVLENGITNIDNFRKYLGRNS